MSRNMMDMPTAKRRPSLMRGLTRVMTQRLTRLRNSARKSGERRVKPEPIDTTELGTGRKLSERMWLDSLQVDAIDVASPELETLRAKASRSFGGECKLHAATCTSMTGDGNKVVLLGLSKVKGDVLIGLYELSEEKGGVLFRRVCDRPARELLAAALLPAGWPRVYRPQNTYGGNRKLPSCTSVADIFSAE